MQVSLVQHIFSTSAILNNIVYAITNSVYGEIKEKHFDVLFVEFREKCFGHFETSGWLSRFSSCEKWKSRVK